MPQLGPENLSARRYAALLHDLVRAGGWLSDDQVALRVTLYALAPGALDELAGATPPFVVRDEGGWAVTTQGLRRVNAWEQRERADIRRASGPAAAA